MHQIQEQFLKLSVFIEDSVTVAVFLVLIYAAGETAGVQCSGTTDVGTPF